MPSYQQGENPIIQNCSCAQCSAVQRTQAEPPTWDLIEQQDPRNYRRAGTPNYQGQHVGTGTEFATIAPGSALAQFAPLQTARVQGCAPVHEGSGPPNMGSPRAQTLDTSIAEGRRRLAGHYLNNPDAFVSTIRLEPGPSGQFQVIITLEMTMT